MSEDMDETDGLISTGPELVSSSYVEIVYYYFILAMTAFGGPPAHISLFLDRFVVQERWLSEAEFTELFAIAQSLPGPASTQVAYAIGLLKQGVIGGLLAFLTWSTPGLVVMVSFSYFLSSLTALPTWFQHVANGLTSAALGLVALAAFKLSNALLNGPVCVLIASFSAALAINYPSIPWLFPALILVGGLISFLARVQSQQSRPLPFTNNGICDKINFSWKTGSVVFFIWFMLLILLILARGLATPLLVKIFATLYYAGSIIFGGGPVVIPLLQNWVVDESNWMSNQEFLLGLALINSMPGPNFNIGAFCGSLALRASPKFMWLGGSIGFINLVMGYFGIFLPGLLLMTAMLPFWKAYRQLRSVESAFKGVNAAAVGLVIASVFLLGNKALVSPLSQANMPITESPFHTALAGIVYALAGFTHVPAPLCVMLGGMAGAFQWYIS